MSAAGSLAVGNRIAESLYVVAITLWVGGMWAIGFLAAPTLFAELGDRALAGSLAGAMFKWGAWVGLACGSYVLLFQLARQGAAAIRSGAFRLALAMVALILVAQFGIYPLLEQVRSAAPGQVLEGAARERFAMWHRISGSLYLVQSLLGIALALARRPGRT